MLHTVTRIRGAKVRATDGDAGHVEEFVFDDDTWTIRYLVVNTETWLNRHVLISPMSIERRRDGCASSMRRTRPSTADVTQSAP